MAKFDIRIENIVASASLGIDVPLEKIVSKLEGMEYEPEQFPGLVYRMKKPKAAALIFGSGKIVCTGARSIKDVNAVFKKVVKIIEKSGAKVPKDFKIQVENIVASAKLDSNLNLDTIAFNLVESEYEPEQFPGLVYRMSDPKVAFLLFGSGKIVCTGARSIKDVNAVFKKVVKIIEKSGAKVPKDFKIQVENIVASAKLDSNLNLDTIAFNLVESEYEPEQFPGLVYRMSDPKVAFLLFGSGKIVCTGARSIKDVDTAVRKISKKLKKIGALVKR